MSVLPAETKAEMEQRVIVFQQLLNTPGWALMVMLLRGFAEAERTAAAKSEAAHLFAMHHGRMSAYLDVANWPERELKLLLSTLQNHDNLTQGKK